MPEQKRSAVTERTGSDTSRAAANEGEGQRSRRAAATGVTRSEIFSMLHRFGCPGRDRSCVPTRSSSSRRCKCRLLKLKGSGLRDAVCARVNTHRLALQGLRGDRLRRDAGGRRSPVGWVSILLGRGPQTGFHPHFFIPGGLDALVKLQL